MSTSEVRMTPEAFQARVDEVWNRHDPDALAPRFAEHGVVRVVATGETARGRDQIREWTGGILRAFPDWHLQVTEAFGDAFGVAGRICSEFVLTGTHEGEFQGISATHRRFEVEVCSVFRMNPQGLFDEEKIFFDSATWLRQLGVLPEPGGTT
jgi:steroid delta-isomerase-like uncharacterized protein